MQTVPHVEAPAFTDWHVHSSLTDLALLQDSPIARVVDLGSNPKRVATDSEANKSGPSKSDPNKKTAAPVEIFYAGAFLTAVGGYPSDRSWAEPGSWNFITDKQSAKGAVSQMQAIGASAIKVALNEVAGPVLSDQLVQEIASAAKRSGLPLIIHAEGPGQAERARTLGANYLAHTPFTEKLTEAEILLQAQSVVWISTLDIHGWGEKTPEFATAVDNLKRFAAAGGRVLYGTDMGNGPTVTGLNDREINALKLAGLTDAQILTALTGETTAGTKIGFLPANKRLKTRIPLIGERLDFMTATKHSA